VIIVVSTLSLVVMCYMCWWCSLFAVEISRSDSNTDNISWSFQKAGGWSWSYAARCYYFRSWLIKCRSRWIQ